MRVIVIAVVSAVLLAQTSGWVPIGSRQGGYYFKMPGQPQKEEGKDEDTGGVYARYKYTESAETPRSMFLYVSYGALDEVPRNQKAVLKIVLESYAKGWDWKVVSSDWKEFRIRRGSQMVGYPGLEAKLRGTSASIVRTFFDTTQHRLFMLVYAANPDRYSEEEAERFFSTFGLY